MNNKLPTFSWDRIRSFISFFHSSEQEARQILTQAQWALPLLNVINSCTDEDVGIISTKVLTRSKIKVSVIDLNTRENLKLHLEMLQNKAAICLDPKQRY